MAPHENIPKRLVISRITAEKNRAETAQHLGVNERTLANWENGQTEITLVNALRLCEFYETTLPELVGDPDFQNAMQGLRNISDTLRRLEEAVERTERSRETIETGKD